MNSVAYYNEKEPYCCDYLENLIATGLLPVGVVDRRPIQEVTADDLEPYTQCHFFAGIGGWPLALRLAGWTDDQPVWTGSCPCQPFSVAGSRQRHNDERHLWPYFRDLAAVGNPPVLFGEQVASKDGREWLTGVRLDLEEMGYAVGAADLCAAGIGADCEVGLVRGGEIEWEDAICGPPHIRQRLYWVADRAVHRCDEVRTDSRGRGEGNDTQKRSSGLALRGIDSHGAPGYISGLPNPIGERLEGRTQKPARQEFQTAERGCNDGVLGLGNSTEGRWARENWSGVEKQRSGERRHLGNWSDFDVLDCLDGKARRTQSGLFPLAHGVPARVGKLRAYGNAIVPELAAEFVRAFMETMGRSPEPPL